MKVLLYVKQTVTEESLLVGDKCLEEDLRSNRSDFSLKLMNVKSSPNENNASGAQLPAPAQNSWCRAIGAPLSQHIDTNTFPFDYQDCKIDLQDDGSPPKRSFCCVCYVLGWVLEPIDV